MILSMVPESVSVLRMVPELVSVWNEYDNFAYKEIHVNSMLQGSPSSVATNESHDVSRVNLSNS